MKKIIVVAVLATVVCSAVVVTSATKDESAVAKPNYPTESSEYYTPAPMALSEKEEIKKQIKRDATDEYLKIFHNLISERNIEYGNQEQLEAAWDAKEQVSVKFAYKVYAILERYNKLEKGYTITGNAEDHYNTLSAMCETLNDPDIVSSLTTEEVAMIELFLEYCYYGIEGDGTEQLKNNIEQLIDLPY